jgi:diguanylate cyclase (GGDEF)-like protein
MMIDVDNFKLYNDTYGHKKGDECLKQIAQVLTKSILRADDFVARYGGEEFVAVLPNINKSAAYMIAERMLNNVYHLKIPHKRNGDIGYVTVSIGACSGQVKYQQNGDEYVTLADDMLYNSKQSGRNRFSYTDI